MRASAQLTEGGVRRERIIRSFAFLRRNCGPGWCVLWFGLDARVCGQLSGGRQGGSGKLRRIFEARTRRLMLSLAVVGREELRSVMKEVLVVFGSFFLRVC